METRPRTGALIIPSGLIEPGRCFVVATLPYTHMVEEGTLAYTIDQGWVRKTGNAWVSSGPSQEQIEAHLIDWMASRDQPIDGKSAYQLALDNGFVGSMSAWLLSLHGTDGTTPTSMSWSALSGTPTTLGGYGITDAPTTGQVTSLLGSLAASIAPVGLSGAYSDLTGRPSLAAVATSGAYADLTGKPTIPAAQLNSDWNAVSGITQIANRPALSSVATSGSYADLSNKPTIPVVNARTYSNLTRALNTPVQLSATREARVHYAVDVQISSLLLGTARGSAYLEYADDSGFTTNVVTVISGTNSTAGVLSLVNIGTIYLGGDIPAAKYMRIRTVTDSGTVGFTSRPGQEVLL